MEGDKANPNLWAFVTILVAIVGCIGAIIASTIGILPDIIEYRATATTVPTNTNMPTLTPSPLATTTPQPSLTPTSVPTQQPPIAEPQEVDWVPYDDTLGTGMRVVGGAEFIPWEELEQEIEQNVLTQVTNVPPGSTLALTDLGERQNWIMQVIDPSGGVVGHVWIGNDPLNGWDFDGLIRVGSPSAPVEVWATFRRYSDGSYRRQ
jgi:hypothetical protein